jgi:hypothetical protein
MGRAPKGTCLAIAAVLVALTAAGAIAASNSKVTVGIGFETRSGHPFFKGRVKSGSKRCRVNRVVRVYRQKNHRNVLFGRTRSESNAHWQLNMPGHMRPAGYIAVVRAKPGCLKGASDPIAVGQNGPGGLG